jgi:hypothetical protein
MPGPLDPVAAQDLIYGVKIDNRTFYIGVFNNGTSLCSYNVSARMESTPSLLITAAAAAPLGWSLFVPD